MKKYSRILLKLSGESLAGGKGFGIDPETSGQFAGEIKQVLHEGIQPAIVIGGGNFWRGRSAPDMEPAAAHQIGMMATVMNALALQDALLQQEVDARVMTAITIQGIAEPFQRLEAVRHLENGRVVIFAAGTGSPFFTTDTAASLRSLEIKADVLIKATRVDGVFDKDPELHEDAHFFDKLTYMEVLKRELKVMDSTAISLCMDNKMPILVFNISLPGSLLKAVRGEKIGTLVKEDCSCD